MVFGGLLDAFGRFTSEKHRLERVLQASFWFKLLKILASLDYLNELMTNQSEFQQVEFIFKFLLYA